MNKGRIRILIVGTGSIGERHIRCFLNTGRVEVAVCETNMKLLRQVRDRYQLSAVFTRLDEALDNNLDAALIATPAQTHISLAQRCADRGLHLLIEKPLALTLDGVETLQHTLDLHNRVGAVAYVWRAHPVFAALRRRLVDGRWGVPLQLTFNTGQHFPTYRPTYRETYYNSRETGGGAILDAASHMVNLGEWLLGPMTHVLADANRLALSGVIVEDTVHVIARHDQAMASYTLNQHQYPNETFLNLVCTDATVRVESHAGRIVWVETPCGSASEEYFTPQDRDAPFIDQAATFIDAMQCRAAPLCTLAEGIQTQRAIEKVLEAADSPSWRTVSSKLQRTGSELHVQSTRT